MSWCTTKLTPRELSDLSHQTFTIFSLENDTTPTQSFNDFLLVSLFIFAAINFCVLMMEWQFVAIYFRISLACVISCNRSTKFSQKYLPHEYRKNK